VKILRQEQMEGLGYRFDSMYESEKKHGLVGADPDDHRRPANILLVDSNPCIDFVITNPRPRPLQGGSS